MRRGLVVASISAGVIASIGAWSWYQRKQQERDPYDVYYRLTVDISDKQGRPIGINIVVGCSLKFSKSIGGGTSVDPGQTSANFFAWKITDGHALTIATTGLPTESGNDPCLGHTTANGRVDKDWLPMIVWHQRAEDLSHGIGYYTRAAYGSPKSNLRFASAKVERATSQEFNYSIRNSAPNLLPSNLSGSLLGAAKLKTKAQITDEIHADPRASWPMTSWLFCNGIVRWDVPKNLQSWLPEPETQRGQNRWVTSYQLGRDISLKISETKPRLSRSSVSETGRNEPIVLPAIRDDGLSALSKDTFKDGAFHLDVSTLQSEQDNGFLFCDRRVPPILFEAITGSEWQKTNITRFVCRINGDTIKNISTCPPDGGYLIYDNRYVFQFITGIAN